MGAGECRIVLERTLGLCECFRVTVGHVVRPGRSSLHEQGKRIEFDGAPGSGNGLGVAAHGRQVDAVVEMDHGGAGIELDGPPKAPIGRSEIPRVQEIDSRQIGVCGRDRGVKLQCLFRRSPRFGESLLWHLQGVISQLGVAVGEASVGQRVGRFAADRLAEEANSLVEVRPGDPVRSGHSPKVGVVGHGVDLLLCRA